MRKLIYYGKYVFMIVVVWLCFGATANASCGMDHDYEADADNKYIPEFLYATVAGDVWGVRESQTCAECFHSRVIVIAGSEYTTPHVFRFAKDLGHGVNEHFHEYRCTTCGMAEKRTVICNGPPCEMMMTKKPVSDECEQERVAELEVE